jgi:hypothetical protein
MPFFAKCSRLNPSRAVEHVDQMLAPLVREDRDAPIADEVEPAAGELESLG